MLSPSGDFFCWVSLENPLAAVTEERAAYLQQEKEFYTVLASKIRE